MMNTPTQNTGAARAWTPEMLEDWEDTLPLIISRLHWDGNIQDADDVHQNTWLAAHNSLNSFNPELGKFGPWIRGIASLEVSRWKRTKSLLSRNDEHFLFTCQTGIATTLSLIEEDIANGIIEDVGDYSRLQQVLTILASVVGNEEHLVRTLNIILAFEGNSKAASRTLGVPERTLRDSHTHTVRMAQVINRALDRYEMKNMSAGITVEDLLACLPDGEAQKLPAAFTALVAMIAGGSDLEVSAVAALGESLGLSEQTSKVYYLQMVKMLSIAKYVMEEAASHPVGV